MYQIDFYFEELVPFKAKSLTNGKKKEERRKNTWSRVTYHHYKSLTPQMEKPCNIHDIHMHKP